MPLSLVFGVHVFMAGPLLFQRQKMFIVCCTWGPKLCHLPRKEPPSRGGGDGRVEKPLTSPGFRRVGSLLMTWFHCYLGEELGLLRLLPAWKKVCEIRIFQPMIEFTRVNSRLPDFLLVLQAPSPCCPGIAVSLIPSVQRPRRDYSGVGSNVEFGAWLGCLVWSSG